MAIAFGTMPFGPHKGKSFDDVPSTYLYRFRFAKFLIYYPSLRSYIYKNWHRIEDDIAELRNQDDFFNPPAPKDKT